MGRAESILASIGHSTRPKASRKGARWLTTSSTIPSGRSIPRHASRRLGCNRRFSRALLQRLLERVPGKRRALHALRKFLHPAHEPEITQVLRRLSGPAGNEIVKGARHFQCFGAALPFQLHRHHGSRRLADRAAMSRELDLVQSALRAEFHGEMNLIAAGGIVAVHADGSIGQLPEIPRPPRMIEDDFLVKFFEFRAHEKKRAASRRISIMRSISAMVL